MITELTEENYLDFKCPYCGAANSFPQGCIGHVRECINCMEALIVPSANSELGRKIPVPIQTSRLVLRRFGPDDLKDMVEFICEDEADVARWLDNDRKVKLTTQGQNFSLAVQVRTGGKIIGCMGLRFQDFDFLEAEISAEWNLKNQSAEFAKEAVQAVLRFYFRELKLHRVIARCVNTETEGCQLLEAVGMRREGEFVKHYRVGDGEWLNTVWFAMLDEECSSKGI
jgi:RimJ/RimL family protein N-acetyltransferase